MFDNFVGKNFANHTLIIQTVYECNVRILEKVKSLFLFLRHGEHPKRWHQIINEKLKTYKAQFIDIEDFCTLPKWINQVTKVYKRQLYARKNPTKLCIRETKWTAPVLKQLYEDLLQIRKETKDIPLTLRTRREIAEVPPATPTIDRVPQEEEELYHAVVLLQKIIRG